MNVKKINELVERTKNDLGDALRSTAIWTKADGQLIAGHNPEPKAAALFNSVTASIAKTLSISEFPDLNDYYLLDLEDDVKVLIMVFEDYQWSLTIDSTKVQLGMLLSVLMPKKRGLFMEALK